MSRKKYPSDKTTTTVRVTRTRFQQVKTVAKEARKTMFVAVDQILAAGLTPKL